MAQLSQITGCTLSLLYTSWFGGHGRWPALCNFNTNFVSSWQLTTIATICSVSSQTLSSPDTAPDAAPAQLRAGYQKQEDIVLLCSDEEYLRYFG